MFSCCTVKEEEEELVVGPLPSGSEDLADQEVREQDQDEWSFDLTLHGVEKGELGVRLDFWPHNLEWQVCSIEDFSPVYNYNTSAPRGRLVRLNDFIISVNGITNQKLAYKAMCQNATVTLRIARPARRTLTMKKGHTSWGMSLSYQERSPSIRIKEIKPGAVLDFNLRRPSMQARVGDYIESVNRLRGSKEILQELQSAIDIEMAVFSIDAPVPGD